MKPIPWAGTVAVAAYGYSESSTGWAGGSEPGLRTEALGTVATDPPDNIRRFKWVRK